MSLVLDGSTQAAYRDNADIQSFLPIGRRVSMWVKLAAAPAASSYSTLLSHDRDESTAQMITFRVKDDRTVRVQLVTGSDDNTDQNKDTTAAIPLDTWVQIIFDWVSSNGSNNYTIGVDIDGSAEQVSPTGTGAYRSDLCTFLGFGAAITSSAVFHSFLNAKIAEIEVFDDLDARIAYWPLLEDAVDAEGDRDLTLLGSPSFDAEDHPGAEPPPPEDTAIVLNGVDQLAYRDNADIANLIVVGTEVRMRVKLASAPGSGTHYDLFTFDRDESSVQMLALRVTENRNVRVMFVTSSQSDTTANKDTTATITLDEWTDIVFKVVSDNGSNNFTFEVTVGENAPENLSPTGAGEYRSDLCTFFSIGAAITSAAVHHSFFHGEIAYVEIYDDTPTLLHKWDFEGDGTDEVGDLDLTLVGDPEFNPPTEPGEPGEGVAALVSLLQYSMSTC